MHPAQNRFIDFPTWTYLIPLCLVLPHVDSSVVRSAVHVEELSERRWMGVHVLRTSIPPSTSQPARNVTPHSVGTCKAEARKGQREVRTVVAEEFRIRARSRCSSPCLAPACPMHHRPVRKERRGLEMTAEGTLKDPVEESVPIQSRPTALTNPGIDSPIRQDHRLAREGSSPVRPCVSGLVSFVAVQRDRFTVVLRFRPGGVARSSTARGLGGGFTSPLHIETLTTPFPPDHPTVLTPVRPEVTGVHITTRWTMRKPQTGHR